LDQFNLLFFEIREFNPFNQILLSLFDISNAFHNNFGLNIKANTSNSINNSNIILKCMWNIKST